MCLSCKFLVYPLALFKPKTPLPHEIYQQMDVLNKYNTKNIKVEI